MRVSRLRLKNWKNFKEVDVALNNRVFIVGPNASGKSNLLDVFRFLKKVAKSGLSEAVEDRGGVSKIRCFAARSDPAIEIEASILTKEDKDSSKPDWRYLISFGEVKKEPIILKEQVWRGEILILNRPDKRDKSDSVQLSQTALEQVSANKEFRIISDFFSSVNYIHLVPQIMRNPRGYAPLRPIKEDPYGSDFISWLKRTPQWKKESQLRRIEEVLKLAVPQLEELKLAEDEKGVPHLYWKEKAWRGYTNITEEQMSDGSIRLLGIIWVLTSVGGPLILEEPELSLHAGFVKKMVPLIYGIESLKKSPRRQLILSTHSTELLSDKGIDASEVLLLYPGTEGTKIQVASEDDEISALLEAGMTPAEVVIPKSKPDYSDRMDRLKNFNER